MIVKIADLNDNGPVFLATPYSLSLAEDTRVGETVFTSLQASDPDHGGNGQLEYSVVPGDRGVNDGYGFFDISLPHPVREDFLTVRVKFFACLQRLNFSLTTFKHSLDSHMLRLKCVQILVKCCNDPCNVL